MRKRIRYYQRQGWTIVTLSNNMGGKPDTNYHSIRVWCERNFKNDDWKASLYGMGDGSRFAFRNPEDAAVFSLRWL
jgi:hypothetical protein